MIIQKKAKFIFPITWLILTTAILLYTVFKINNFKYPYLDIRDYEYIGLLYLPLLTYLVFKTKRVLKSKISKTVLIIVLIIVTVFSSFCLALTPYYLVIESYTSNPRNYLKFDDYAKLEFNDYSELIPDKIPEDAQKIEYLYNRWDYGWKFRASWSQDEKEYEKEKNRIENIYLINGFTKRIISEKQILYYKGKYLTGNTYGAILFDDSLKQTEYKLCAGEGNKFYFEE